MPFSTATRSSRRRLTATSARGNRPLTPGDLAGAPERSVQARGNGTPRPPPPRVVAGLRLGPKPRCAPEGSSSSVARACLRPSCCLSVPRRARAEPRLSVRQRPSRPRTFSGMRRSWQTANAAGIGRQAGSSQNPAASLGDSAVRVNARSALDGSRPTGSQAAIIPAGRGSLPM
jgi:hypothetical protein